MTESTNEDDSDVARKWPKINKVKTRNCAEWLHQGDASNKYKLIILSVREQQRTAAPSDNMVSKPGARPANALSHTTQ